MTTLSRIITNDEELHALQRLLDAREKPFTVAIRRGKHRTNPQNRLQRLWVKEAAEQLQDETAEEKRGYCKLHFGVPILRSESEEFAAKYDDIIKPLPYPAKLALMQIPFDFSVTSLMNTKQKKQYLDAVYVHFKGLGVQLTEPKER